MPRRKPAGEVVANLLQVKDLSAGVNLRQSPTTIQPSQARKLINWSLEEPGALVAYPGFKSFSTTSLGSGRPQGGQRVYLASSVFTLAAWSGGVYKPSDAGVWGSAVLSGLNASNDIFFPHDRDIVSVMDGANVPKKSTDGTTWTQHGISPPAAPTLALAAGGSLIVSKQYEVSYSYQDDALNHEGNEGPTASITTTAGNLTITVTVANSGDPQVDRKNIYVRNVTDGEAVRRFIGSTTSTTFSITGPDSAWASGREAPTDHSVPPALSWAVVWKNRWWARDATVKNRIRFTQLFQNQSWPGTFFIDIPFERGEDVTAAFPLGDTLVVCGYTNKYVIIGQTSLDFEVRPTLGSQAGAFGQRAIDAIEDGVVAAAAQGVYVFDGAADRELSFEIGPGWIDMIAGASGTDLDRIPITYHASTKELRVGVPRLFPTGAFGEWILDLNRTRLQEGRPAWTSTNRAIGGYISWDGRESVTGNRGRIFSWSNTIGKLFEERVGTDADGADMTCEYEGPTHTTGLQTARFIDAYVEFQPQTGLFAVETLVDGKSQGSQTIDISGATTKYGTKKYGTFKYGGGGDRKSKPLMLPLTAEGSTIKVLAKYVGKAKYRWFTYGIGVSPEPLPRGI